MLRRLFGREDGGRLLRHLLLGGTCFLLNLGLLALLVELLAVDVLVATALCFFALNAFSHHFARRVVFRSESRTYGKSLLRYLLVMAAMLALNLAAMALATRWLGVPYLAASAVIAALFFLGNYLAHRDWTFGRGGDPQP